MNKMFYGFSCLIVAVISVTLSMFDWGVAFAIGFSLGGTFVYFLIHFMEMLDD